MGVVQVPFLRRPSRGKLPPIQAIDWQVQDYHRTRGVGSCYAEHSQSRLPAPDVWRDLPERQLGSSDSSEREDGTLRRLRWYRPCAARIPFPERDEWTNADSS